MVRIELLCVVSLFAAACADAALVEPAPEREQLPPEFSSNGLRHTPLYKNRSDLFELKTVTLEGGAQDDVAVDLASLSDAEFAQRLTGFTELRGYVYRVQPELDFVRELRKQPPRVIVPGMAGGVDLERQEPGGDEPVEGSIASYIIPDGRDWEVRRDNAEYPMRTIVQGDNGATGCTGVMIGQSTLLSASHCYFDGRWFRDPYVFRPGADADDGDPFPWGEWDCYGIWAAGGGVNGDVGTDFAVIDFRYSGYGCNGRPGFNTGYMGTKTFSSTDLESKPLHLHGYPTFLEPYPQLWGMSGNLLGVYDRILDYDMDEEDGHSGAPVYYFEPGVTAPFVAAINSGGNGDFGRLINRGARFTIDMWYAIQSWSVEY